MSRSEIKPQRFLMMLRGEDDAASDGFLTSALGTETGALAITIVAGGGSSSDFGVFASNVVNGITRRNLSSEINLFGTAGVPFEFDPVFAQFRMAECFTLDDELEPESDVNQKFSNISWLYAFNGVTGADPQFDRLRTVSITNINEPKGTLAVNQPMGENDVDESVVNVAATVTKASAGAGLSNVAKSITGAIAGPDASGIIFLRIRDGAGGTIIWSTVFNKLATEGMAEVTANFNVVGSAATAMVAEFSGAVGAANQSTISMETIVIGD